MTSRTIQTLQMQVTYVNRNKHKQNVKKSKLSEKRRKLAKAHESLGPCTFPEDPIRRQLTEAALPSQRRMPGRGARVARGRNPPPKTHEYLNDTAKCTYHLYLSSLALFLNLTSLSVGFNGFSLCLCSPSLSPASFRSHFLSSLSFIVRFTFSSYLSICSYFPSFFMLVSYPFLPYLTSPFGLPSFLFHCISLRPATFLSKMIFNNKK